MTEIVSRETLRGLAEMIAYTMFHVKQSRLYQKRIMQARVR